MLKNVVFPAPLGPMIDTIEPVGIVERDVVDRDEAAELLDDLFSDEQRRCGRLVRARPPVLHANPVGVDAHPTGSSIST